MFAMGFVLYLYIPLSLIVLGWKTVDAGANYHMCDTTHVTLGGVGSSGNITSMNFPGSISDRETYDNMCSMTLSSCPGCRITLKILLLELPHCSEYPSYGSCIYGCDHLMMYEFSYPEGTTQYYRSGQVGETYETQSSSLYVKYCHSVDNNGSNRRFVLQYIVYEKLNTFLGHSGEKGYFTSPYFPRGFQRLSEEVFYYHLQNMDGGYMKLWFDDWSLPKSAQITFFNGPSTQGSTWKTYKGDDKRPFFVSSQADVLVKLNTGNINDFWSTHVGFLARYEFVQDPVWKDKPMLDCGEYLSFLSGGHFGFSLQESHCSPSSYLDCVWVIWKYDQRHKLMLYFEQTTFGYDDQLEVRDGNNSLGMLLGNSTNLAHTSEFVTTSDALYIRYKGRCTIQRGFNAVFATFMDAALTCEDSFFQVTCANERCIASSLACDGYNHCHDTVNSDELFCKSTTPGYWASYPTSHCDGIIRCHSNTTWYCKEKHCDGYIDCPDGSDEESCWISSTPSHHIDSGDVFSAYHWGTIIPIILICIVLAVIACIIVSYYTRRKQRARQRRLAANAQQPSFTNPGSLYRYPDAPPTYEESMMSPHSNGGIFNMAYSRSDSMECLGLPPPYSPMPSAFASAPCMPNVSSPVVISNQSVAGQPNTLVTGTGAPRHEGFSNEAPNPLGIQRYRTNGDLINRINQVQEILTARQYSSPIHRRAGETSPVPISNSQSRSGQGEGQVSLSGQGALAVYMIPQGDRNSEMQELSSEAENFVHSTNQPSSLPPPGGNTNNHPEPPETNTKETDKVSDSKTYSEDERQKPGNGDVQANVTTDTSPKCNKESSRFDENLRHAESRSAELVLETPSASFV